MFKTNEQISKELAETYYSVKGFNTMVTLYEEMKKLLLTENKFPFSVVILDMGVLRIRSRDELISRIKQMAFILFKNFDIEVVEKEHKVIK